VISEINRRGELVLVLDNCEHVLDMVADLVTSLLDGCASLRLLCTSREPLDIEGEHVVRLSPLATSQAGTRGPDGAAGAGDAEVLFRSRAEAAGAVVPPGEQASVIELCELLDGLPLALELAAARAPLMPVRSLLDGLKERDIPLSRRGGEARQRSLDSVVSWSLKLLEPADCDALFALAVFPGRFTAEMAEAILSAVPGVRRHAFADLARRSLLDLDGAEYRMLVSVGDVARRELAARPETRRAALDGLFGWALACSGAPPNELISPDQLRAMEVAAEWGLQNQLPERGRVVGRLARWTLEGTVSPSTMAWAERALVEPLAADADQVRINAAALRLVRGLATTVSDDVHVDRARALVAVARSLDDPQVLRTATSEAAIILDRAGLQAEAEPLHQETVRLSEAPDQSVGPALLDLGVSYHLVGKLGEAEQNYRSALAHVGDDPLNRTSCLINLGEVMLDAGRFDEAASQLRAALQDARSHRPKAGAWALALLAEAEARRGAIEEARALAEQAERDLLPLCAGDPSLRSVLDRMHKALRT
jgi:non-specific serine/threonine protein kinase